MKLSILISSKALLTCCNFLLLVSGSVLVSVGFLVLCDSERILLSRLLVPGPEIFNGVLPHPLFYYVALGLIGMGLLLCAVGVLGCWAACIESYLILTAYFTIILLILLGECAIYAMVSVWPQCLGLAVSPEDLAREVQRSYGVAGQEQLTAAVDLAQVMFRCCGISTSTEYDTSLWRLQSLGHPSLAVPLSCCRLNNANQSDSYLDPKPINLTYCQMVEIESQQGYRHSEGCILKLEHWYQEQYLLFVILGLIVILIEFASLLCTILACTKVYKHRQISKKQAKEETKKKDEDNTYQNRSIFSYSNDAYSTTNSFRQNYRLVDKT